MDIVLLDARQICSFADYFVIATGESAKQIEAIRDEIVKTIKEAGVRPHHYEGSADSGWLLIDFIDVIIHLFSPAERERYALDELWRRATPVVKIQ